MHKTTHPSAAHSGGGLFFIAIMAGGRRQNGEWLLPSTPVQKKQPTPITRMDGCASELPEKQRNHLQGSWTGAFDHEFFHRIDEEAFTRLPSERRAWPNMPAKVLVGLAALKSGLGWRDQELEENGCDHLQVRYSLGQDRLRDGDFVIRTCDSFRTRLSRHPGQEGANRRLQSRCAR